VNRAFNLGGYLLKIANLCSKVFNKTWQNVEKSKKIRYDCKFVTANNKICKKMKETVVIIFILQH
jgi:hypothetical protein